LDYIRVDELDHDKFNRFLWKENKKKYIHAMNNDIGRFSQIYFGRRGDREIFGCGLGMKFISPM
jgi:hypothetical protein